MKARTGQKGKALFHPIRVALTGRAEGPELDLAVPAIDRGAELPRVAGMPTIVGCRERAAAFARGARRELAQRHQSCASRAESTHADLRHQPGPRGAARRARDGDPRVAARRRSRRAPLVRLARASRACRCGACSADELDRAARGGVHQGVVADVEDAGALQRRGSGDAARRARR